ncbi:MAG: DsbA family oxidoreductase [Pseudomonadota bacterium]
MVTVDIVSDVMCPWCYIGKRKLEDALQKLDGHSVSIRWRPYQLDATLPPEGKDRREYLETKFGGPERAREIYGNIEKAGADEGLDFNFKAIAVSPNTLDAHRVIRWAANEGEDVQGKVVERLFKLFFMDGVNIGDRAVLIECARDCGMDAPVVEALLATDKDRAEVEAEIETARQMGVTGVPCFIIDQKYALMGAQPADQLAAAISQAAKEAQAR